MKGVAACCFDAHRHEVRLPGQGQSVRPTAETARQPRCIASAVIHHHAETTYPYNRLGLHSPRRIAVWIEMEQWASGDGRVVAVLAGRAFGSVCLILWIIGSAKRFILWQSWREKPHNLQIKALRARMDTSVELANQRAFELINFAEAMFGPMTSEWVFGGVIFQDTTPHLSYLPYEGKVDISISTKCIGDDVQMYFQLSHEVCHLLYPSKKFEDFSGYDLDASTANVLNEGISTYFSICIVGRIFDEETVVHCLCSLQENSPNYFSALQAVTEMMKSDKDSVKKIREVNPMINDVTLEDLEAADIDLKREHLAFLVQSFAEL